MSDLRSTDRDRGMDVLRGAAVLCMIAVHSARVVVPLGAGATSFRAAASLFEPAISVAFLWLVGWSLERSHARTSQSGTGWWPWYSRALARAATLYGLGVLLFALQYGVVAPDIWASPDVLGAIAWAIVALGALLRWGLRGLVGGAIATLALAALVEGLRVHVSGINAGPGATLPLVVAAFAGACHGRTARRRPSSNVWCACLGAITAAAACVLPGALVDLHRSTHPHVAAPWFWNHTLKGIAVYGGAVAVFAGVLAGARVATRASRPLELLGRHALVAYVGHLFVLGAVQRWMGLPSGWSMLVFVTSGLAVTFTSIAMVLESPLGGRARRTARHLGLSI